MLHLQELPDAFTKVDEVTAIVTPYLPLLGTLVGGIVIGGFAIWNRKRGAVETRAPDVNEIWNQQAKEAMELDHERTWRRHLQDYAWEVRNVFKGYVRRVHNGGSIELTERERLVHDSEPPTDGIDIKVKTQ